MENPEKKWMIWGGNRYNTILVTDQVTTATIAGTPKTQLQPPFSPSVDSLCHP